MPETILAERYNALRTSVNLVLGISSSGTPEYGYGQGFNTTSVIGSRAANDIANADKVLAQDYEDLYIDMIRARSHQVGVGVAIDEFVVGDYEANSPTADKIEEAYVLGLESLATNLETDKFLVDSNNLRLTSAPLANSSRPDSQGTWNGTISHIFTMTFTTETERRHFFNAGGEIRLSASVDYSGSQAKTVDWQVILNAMGSTSFKATSTANNAAVGTGSSIGNYDLTNSYQLVYSRTGGAVYARNRYNVYAKEYATGNTTSAIQFKVDFVDGQPNNTTWGIDEVVSGTFNSNVQTATPDSEITINGTLYPAVSIELDPTATIISTLS
jgi:hypothetical protein